MGTWSSSLPLLCTSDLHRENKTDISESFPRVDSMWWRRAEQWDIDEIRTGCWWCHLLLWHRGCRGSSDLLRQLDQRLDRKSGNNLPLQPPNLVCSGSAGAADLWRRGGGRRRGRGGTDCPPGAVFRRTSEAHLGGGVSPGDGASPLPSNQSDCMCVTGWFWRGDPAHRRLAFARRARETTPETCRPLPSNSWFLTWSFLKASHVPKTSSSKWFYDFQVAVVQPVIRARRYRERLILMFGFSNTHFIHVRAADRAPAMTTRLSFHFT